MEAIINKKVIDAAIGEYGTQNELLVAIEEMSELSKVITKHLRSDAATCEDDILEELADVIIALTIVMCVFGVDEESLESMITKKQIRTLTDIYGCKEMSKEELDEAVTVCTINDFDEFVKIAKIVSEVEDDKGENS